MPFLNDPTTTKTKSLSSCTREVETRSEREVNLNADVIVIGHYSRKEIRLVVVVC